MRNKYKMPWLPMPNGTTKWVEPPPGSGGVASGTRGATAGRRRNRRSARKVSRKNRKASRKASRKNRK